MCTVCGCEAGETKVGSEVHEDSHEHTHAHEDGSERTSAERRRSGFIHTPIAMPMAASTAMRIRTLASTPMRTDMNTIITNMASPLIWTTAPAPPAPMRRV